MYWPATSSNYVSTNRGFTGKNPLSWSHFNLMNIDRRPMTYINPIMEILPYHLCTKRFTHLHEKAVHRHKDGKNQWPHQMHLRIWAMRTSDLAGYLQRLRGVSYWVSPSHSGEESLQSNSVVGAVRNLKNHSFMQSCIHSWHIYLIFSLLGFIFAEPIPAISQSAGFVLAQAAWTFTGPWRGKW